MHMFTEHQRNQGVVCREKSVSDGTGVDFEHTCSGLKISLTFAGYLELHH